MKTKSLTFRIFFSTVLVGILVYFVSMIFFVSQMYSYFEDKIFDELETEAAFLESYVEPEDLESLAKFKSVKIKNRITLIHADGTVFFDNEADVAKMESHAFREEFLKAKENGTAKVSRYSFTMLDKTLYFAKLLSNGDVLRISCEQRSVGLLIFGFSQPLLATLVIALLISGIAATLTSKKIVEPLDKIDLENPEKSEVYDELKPFTKRIAKENFEKEQREELRKQFSANVSHELKTPLTSISGFAEILKSGETDKKTTKDFAATIYEESQRMINLVNDIIKLSKLDEKSISMEKEDLSLLEVAEEAAKVLQSSAKKKNVTLKIHGDAGNISGVRPVIYEMIFNLIDNAIKYNRDGGKVDVCVTDRHAETATRHSERSEESLNTDVSHSLNMTRERDVSAKPQHGVSISVSDNGIGIPENEQERIFERFYRVDKSRSKSSGGTGLGLSIVKHAAKYHNARITLDSKLGVGSKFTVEF